MIKYPVRVERSEDCDGMFCIVTPRKDVIAKTYTEIDANIIASALNAMNEFPNINQMLDGNYTSDDFVNVDEEIASEVTGWYKKHLAKE